MPYPDDDEGPALDTAASPVDSDNSPPTAPDRALDPGVGRDDGLISALRLAILILGLAIIILGGIAGLWISINRDRIDVGHDRGAITKP